MKIDIAGTKQKLRNIKFLFDEHIQHSKRLIYLFNNTDIEIDKIISRPIYQTLLGREVSLFYFISRYAGHAEILYKEYVFNINDPSVQDHGAIFDCTTNQLTFSPFKLWCVSKGLNIETEKTADNAKKAEKWFSKIKLIT